VEKERVLFLSVVCPLCGSGTHIWTEGIDIEVSEKIRKDFPRWTPEAGACDQCIEAYTPMRLI